MEKSVYHIGVYKRNMTAVFQMVKNVDFLNCETVIYYGPRINTKVQVRKDIKANKEAILKSLKEKKIFKDCKYIAVE